MILNLKDGEYFGKHVKSHDNSFFKLSLTCNEPNSKTERHYHDNDYLSILSVGNYYERNVKSSLVKTGDIVFRPKEYTHENQFDAGKSRCFNIEFKSDWQHIIDLNLNLPSSFKHYKSGSFATLYKLLYNFINDYNEDLAYELICDWISQVNPDTKTSKYQLWIKKIVSIIDNELDVFHSLQGLSERVCVHPSYLARAFKEKMGLTIGEYQIKSKLSNAIHLLLNTSLSISEISHRNGFYDDAHFIRSFKTVYNVSPHQFRLTIKK